MTEFVHDTLPCGIEYGVAHLPSRHVVSFQFRFLVGTSSEPVERLGLAHVVEDTLDKGTVKRTAQELSDAFDALGAGRNGGTGRESTTFTCTVLPENFEAAVALHAEFLRTPTFPGEAVEVCLELAKQEIEALDDDPAGLVDKYISRRAYGALLGRHTLGEPETLERIRRADVERFWREHFSAGRMTATVAGPLSAKQVAEVLGRHFDGFGSPRREGRAEFPVEFRPTMTHYPKDLQQEQIGICWPGVSATHADFPTQQAVLGILSGGMSGRLFTEVREKQGLVYWVGAWQETPRGAGMLFLGASTTPQRCDQTYSTLLREVDRLAEDIEQEELDRAVTGILAQQDTRGDTTRSRCSELASDLFFYGRPVSFEEKSAKLRAVTVDKVRAYLREHPRDRRCVVTLGPRALAGTQETVAHEERVHATQA